VKQISVKSSDGLKLAAGEWGNPAGPEILFIHGFCQSALSWTRQLDDPQMASSFRMIAYDLRGHGGSDKPGAKENYTDDRLWADDVAAVMAAAGLKRPVLVGWSYGGRVVADYVRVHGLDRVAGINFVAAVTKSSNEMMGPEGRHIGAMSLDDLATNIAATRAFLRACFEKQPDADDFETMLAFNMMIPPDVRAFVRSRTQNPGDMLAKMTVPVLVTHGDKDRLILPAFGEFTAGAVPGAKLSVYQGIGHAPFFEDAPRFNRELATFVLSANKS